MAIPVINPPITPRIIGSGIDFSLTITATNTPNHWTATGLPPGLSISSAGVLSGKPGPGEFSAAITAHHKDGGGVITDSSSPVPLLLIVLASPPGIGDPLERLLDWEQVSGKVSVPGVTLEEGEPVMWVKESDRFPLLVGVLRYGVLQDAGAEVTIKLGFKEFEPDGLVYITSDTVEKVGTLDDLTRYRVWVNIRKELWAGVLSNYENDDGTAFLPLAELKLVSGNPYSQEQVSSSMSLTSNVGAGAGVTKSLVFSGLGAYDAPYAFELFLKLNVTGRPFQSVQLTRSLKVVKTGGVWVTSDLSGVSSAQGGNEDPDWRATLESVSVVGDGSGLTANCKVTTTTATGRFALSMSAHNTSPSQNLTDVYTPVTWNYSPRLFLHDESGSLIGSSAIVSDGATSDTFDDPAHFLASVRQAWRDSTGIYPPAPAAILVTTITGAITFEIARDASSSVHFATITTGSEPDEYSRTPLTSSTSSATITGTLTQLEGGETIVSSRYFRIGVERAINPAG